MMPVASMDHRSRDSSTAVGLYLLIGALDDALLRRRKRQLIAFAIFAAAVLNIMALLR
jgi:hypothetical protein